jgi:hypothetical protein
MEKDIILTVEEWTLKFLHLMIPNHIHWTFPQIVVLVPVVDPDLDLDLHLGCVVVVVVVVVVHYR